MKIAYVMYPGGCYVGNQDGQKMQAIIWARGLEKYNHEIDFINPWEKYNWDEYDIIHVFGIGLWNYDFIHWGSRLNANFVFSPIIDSTTPIWKYKLATYCGIKKLRLYSQNYMLRKLKNDIKLFYSRSNYESSYLEKGYGISHNKIINLPLSYRFDNYKKIPKEKFCLFVGTITQERKNVLSLIKAAIKYNFKLVLVGNTGNKESFNKVRSLISDKKNIEIKGIVSDQELITLYNKAKVLALPSINEGVGLVALEAAVHGCDIVITEIGGPKEYYNNMAYTVNPYDIDDIGKKVILALNENKYQPQLRQYIINNYSLDHSISKLINSYKALL